MIPPCYSCTVENKNNYDDHDEMISFLFDFFHPQLRSLAINVIDYILFYYTFVDNMHFNIEAVTST